MPSSVTFGAFRLLPDTGELWHGDKAVKLTPRAAAVLALLAKRAQQVVTKEELVAHVWRAKAVGDDALTACIQELRQALGDNAREPRFIETWHRRGYKLVVPASSAVTRGPAMDDAPPPPLPDKPSIAVLPFQNLSGDPAQEYFVDGVVEDITTALSRVRWLFVIARNSSFTYKGRAVDVKQAGRDLGVRYIMDGSFRKAGDRVRITARLVDAASGVHLWSHRLDGSTEDIFALQDQVTESVVGVLTPSLQGVEIDRVRRKPAANMDAYDFYLRAEAGVRARNRTSTEEALSFCIRAIALDCNFAPAYGTAARCYSLRKSNGWATDPPKDAIDAERMARGAWAADPDDAEAIAYAAHALAYVAKDLDSAAAYIERARTGNPNYAPCWGISGWINVWLGRNDIAVEHAARAMRLSPRDPNLAAMRTITAHAHYFAGRYAEARTFANLALRERPTSHESLRIGAAAAAMGGHKEESTILSARLRQIDPRLRASSLRDVLGPYRNPEHLARYAEGLRRAGVPD